MRVMKANKEPNCTQNVVIHFGTQLDRQDVKAQNMPQKVSMKLSRVSLQK